MKAFTESKLLRVKCRARASQWYVNDIIRALDSGYIYVGSQVIKYGQRGWSFCAARYGKSQPGSSLQNFSATAYGQESDEEFWLCGESDADANIQVAIHGWRVAGLL
jgi:hypothetical protein